MDGLVATRLRNWQGSGVVPAVFQLWSSVNPKCIPGYQDEGSSDTGILGPLKIAQKGTIPVKRMGWEQAKSGQNSWVGLHLIFPYLSVCQLQSVDGTKGLSEPFLKSISFSAWRFLGGGVRRKCRRSHDGGAAAAAPAEGSLGPCALCYVQKSQSSRIFEHVAKFLLYFTVFHAVERPKTR